jgi:hypothetical protein
MGTLTSAGVAQINLGCSTLGLVNPTTEQTGLVLALCCE